MGSDRDRKSIKPSRRAVLTASLSAAVGVAVARLAGLRAFDERIAGIEAQKLLGLRPSAPGAPVAVDMAGAPESMPAAIGALAPELPLPATPMLPRPGAAIPPTLAVSGDASVAAPGASARPLPAARQPDAVTGGAIRGASYDWDSPLGSESARVAQLLRRATFGATDAELERALSDGYARTVDRLVETPFADPPPLAGADDANQTKPLQVQALQSWWLDAMQTSPTPFGERMTLFWHGHFTSDYRKVGLQSPFMYWQNQTFRRQGLGDLKTMLMSVTTDPAMLRYLDLGISTGRNPNENYARELMELYSLGVDRFSEDDVRAAAKALAGWREPRTQAMVDALNARAKPGAMPAVADPGKSGVFDRARAFSGTLTYLGKTGSFDTEAVIDRILAQDATAPFVVRRVLAQFVHRTPADALVDRLAARFRAARYDLKSLMRDVFTSPELSSPESYRALVKSPIEFMVSVAKALGTTPQLTRAISGASSGMGQVLFDPPSVGGWPRNEAWVSSNTVVARANFVTQAIGQTRTLPAGVDAYKRHLDGVVGPATAELLTNATDDRSRWSVVLSSAEFQLK